MGLRNLARQRALQLLYGLQYSGLSYDEGEAEFLAVNAKRRKVWSEFASELARATFEEHEALDEEIKPYLKNWKIERIPRTDLLCLRMAVCELQRFPDIPLRATLNEYIELARLFGTDDSPAFINGVLDQIAEKFRGKDFKKKKLESDSGEAVEIVDDSDETEIFGAEPTEETAL